MGLAEGGALGVLVSITAVLLRFLLKTDNRWENLVDDISKERDEWRSRYFNLLEQIEQGKPIKEKYDERNEKHGVRPDLGRPSRRTDPRHDKSS